MTYVPLHVHSEYSLLDGLSQASQISKRLNKIEIDTCALTIPKPIMVRYQVR